MLGLLGFHHCLLSCASLLDGGIFLHASLNHRFGGFHLVVSARFEQTGNAVGSVAITVGWDGRLVENVLGVIAEFRFAIVL